MCIRRYCILMLALALSLAIGCPVHAENEEMPDPEAAAHELPYYIGVDLTNQIVTVYRTQDGVIARQMLCSSGMNDSTPEGVFYMEEGWRDSERSPWTYLEQYQCWVRYATRIRGGYMFHSLPFQRQDATTMIEKSARELGTPTSHGCLRLRVDDARFICENCPVGTLVRIYREPEPQEELRKLLLANSYTGEGGMSYDEFQGYSQDELGRGSGGTQVKDLQSRLLALGYFNGTVSGRYDTDTVTAIKQVQADLGMAQTGITSSELSQLLFSDDAPVATGEIDLCEGRSGPVVRKLQDGLARLGLYQGDMDSVYDLEVADAVRLFQGLCNERVDGVATAMQQQILDYVLKQVDDTFGSGNAPVPEVETQTLQMATLRSEAGVIVRKRATTKSDELGKLHDGDIIIVDGVEGEWAQISDGTGTGYIMKLFLEPFTQENVMLTFRDGAGNELHFGHTREEYRSGAQSLSDEYSAWRNGGEYGDSETVRCVTVDTGSPAVSLKLRSSAGTDGEVLDELPDGTTLRVLSEGTGWTQVGYGTHIGYLMNDYLRFSDVSPQELAGASVAETQAHSEVAQTDINEAAMAQGDNLPDSNGRIMLDAQGGEAGGGIEAVVVCHGEQRAPVYDAGSQDATRLGSLSEGTRLEVVSLGEEDDWVQISYKGHTGYMLDANLQFQLM